MEGPAGLTRHGKILGIEGIQKLSRYFPKFFSRNHCLATHTRIVSSNSRICSMDGLRCCLTSKIKKCMAQTDLNGLKLLLSYTNTIVSLGYIIVNVRVLKKSFEEGGASSKTK